MCGINGFAFSSLTKLKEMNTIIKHRGPDYAGEYCDAHISIGHVLLSIRDNVDKSRQPYFQNNSEWILAFNGQIYNTHEIVNQYLADGRDPHTLDTELLYALIQKYGWNFIDKIHGMFAIALYNKQENVIKLYRDPSGQKNLYYYYDSHQFIFSSEIKAILSHSINKDANSDAVSIACSIGYLPGQYTLFQNIYKLLPSECVTYDLNKREVSKNFYKSHFSDGYNKHSILSDIMAEHLQSKVNISLNLSGGLDSSLILHEASKLNYRLDTYTTYFDIPKEHTLNEDALLAKKLSLDYDTNHSEIFVTKESYFDNFLEAYGLIEEPNYNISLPIYLQTAKQEGMHGDKKRVVLSGDGGDEVFSGYSYYLANKKYDLFIKWMTPYLFNKLKNKGKTHYKYQNIPERWFSFKNMGNGYLKSTTNFEATLNYISEIYGYYHKLYGIEKSSVHNMMLLDRVIWLASENFIRSDKLFMSQSLELRSPLSYMPLRNFFDNNLHKTEYINEHNNKLFLRTHYQNALPKYILDKKKSGWRAPVEIWYDKKYKDLFLDILSSVDESSDLIDWNKIKSKVYQTDKWPGKNIHLYLSLAILSSKYKLNF